MGKSEHEGKDYLGNSLNRVAKCRIGNFNYIEVDYNVIEFKLKEGINARFA